MLRCNLFFYLYSYCRDPGLSAGSLCRLQVSVLSIVVNPNTLNLDADPELWPNFLDQDPGPDPVLCYQF